MTVDVLQKPSFFRFLSAIDSDLANRARLQSCNFCGGTLHSACYRRKPRGGSFELGATAYRYAFSGDWSILGFS